MRYEPASKVRASAAALRQQSFEEAAVEEAARLQSGAAAEDQGSNERKILQDCQLTHQRQETWLELYEQPGRHS